MNWNLHRRGVQRAHEAAYGVVGERLELEPVDASQPHPDCEYLELDGVGHVPQLKVPDLHAREVLDWLGRRVTQPA